MAIISASQAISTVNGNNKRKIEPIPDFLLQQRDSQPSVYIYNIYPHQHQKQLAPHGLFIIPACPDNGTPNNHENWAPYSKPLIIASIVFEYYDAGDLQLKLQYWSGRDVAKDVTGEAEGIDGNDLRNWGVFIAAGEKPTPQELLEAKRRLTLTMHKFLNQGDLLYAGTQTERNQLSSIHRKAASFLGQDRVWDTTPIQMVDCRFCYSRVNPLAAKCNSCGSILDREKWESGQDGFVPPVEHKPTSKKSI